MGTDDMVPLFEQWDDAEASAVAPAANGEVVVVPLDDVRWEVVRLAAALFIGDEGTQSDALDRLGHLLGITESEIITAAGRLRPGTFA